MAHDYHTIPLQIVGQIWACQHFGSSVSRCTSSFSDVTSPCLFIYCVFLQTAVQLRHLTLPMGSRTGACQFYLGTESILFSGYITKEPDQWSPVIWALSSLALKLYSLIDVFVYSFNLKRLSQWMSKASNLFLMPKQDRFLHQMWYELNIVICLPAGWD